VKEKTIMEELAFPSDWKVQTFRWALESRKINTSENLTLLGANIHLGVTERFEGDGRAPASEDLSKYKKVEPGDIIMNPLGKPHGSIGRSNVTGITSPAYWVLRVNNKENDSNFFHYLLRSEFMIQEFVRRSKNLPPNQFDLPWEDFRQISIALPPLGQQRKISTFLENETEYIDLIVGKKRELVKILEENLQNSISEILNNFIQQVKLKYRFSVASGNSISAEFIADNNLENASGLPFIATKEVGIDGVINYDTEIRIPPELLEGFRTAKPGVIFVCSEGGSAGKKFGLNTELVTYGNKLFALTSKTEMSEKLLFYIFLSRNFQSQFKLGMNGMIGGISSGALGEILIPDVTSDQQHNLLSTLESKYKSNQESIKKIESSILLLQNYRSSLITSAVTGQLDLASRRSVL
jgi:type I restriction enzyme S subunit